MSACACAGMYCTIHAVHTCMCVRGHVCVRVHGARTNRVCLCVFVCACMQILSTVLSKKRLEKLHTSALHAEKGPYMHLLEKIRYVACAERSISDSDDDWHSW